MFKIKHIFDGEYGCEEKTQNSEPMVLVTLTDENGKEKQRMCPING